MAACKVMIRAIKLLSCGRSVDKTLYTPPNKVFFLPAVNDVFLGASSLRSSAKWDFFALVASLLVQPGLSKHCYDLFLLEI